MEPLFRTQTLFDLNEYTKFNEAVLLDSHNEQLRPINEKKNKKRRDLKILWIMVAIGLLEVVLINLLMWASKGGSYPEFSSLIVKIVNILGAIALGTAIIATLLRSIIFVSPSILKWVENKSLQALRKSAEKKYNSNDFKHRNSLWSYSFFDDYLEEKDEKSYDKLEYSMIHKIIESDSNFYIMKNEKRGYIIVKSNCSPELIEFIQNLKPHGSK